MKGKQGPQRIAHLTVLLALSVSLLVNLPGKRTFVLTTRPAHATMPLSLAVHAGTARIPISAGVAMQSVPVASIIQQPQALDNRSTIGAQWGVRLPSPSSNVLELDANAITPTWSLQRNGQGSGLKGITCPSVMRCYAVGGNEILTTIDSGVTWDTISGGPHPYLTTITCPAFHTCYANAGSTIWKTADAGISWTKQWDQASGSSVFLAGMACPSDSTCYTVGSGFDSCSGNCFYNGLILATTNGGVTWQYELHPGTVAGRPALHSVACPDISTCFAVGDNGMVVKTSEGGATWSSQRTPNPPPGVWGTTGLESIACPSVRACYAVGGLQDGGHPQNLSSAVILTTTDGGSDWSLQSKSTVPALFSIACPTSTICYAGGEYGVRGRIRSRYYSCDYRWWGHVDCAACAICQPYI